MWEQIRDNKRKSVYVITGMAGVLVLMGYGIGLVVSPPNAWVGVVLAVVIWCILWGTAAASGSGLLLMSSGAQEISHDDNPRLDNIVEEMSIAAGLPAKPKVFIMDNAVPNAFAVGTPQKSGVAVTTGLLTRLNRDELQGVIAHEVGHIRNQDTRFMTLAGVMLGAIVLLADVLLRAAFFSGISGGRRRSSSSNNQGAALFMIVAIILAILAPIVAQILYFACSRRREYLADASAARFTRYPEGLASALEKISGGVGKMEGVSRATAPMYIVNPLQAAHGASGLMSTHPDTGERIRILRSMGGGADYASYEKAFAGVTRQKLMGAQTLAEDTGAPARSASTATEADSLTRTREAMDIVHRMAGFLFLSCACGLRIKIPPSYAGRTVACPRCSRSHQVPAAAAFAAAATMAHAVEKAEAEADGGKAAAKGAAPAASKPLVFRRKGGGWESFRCSCGKTVQISPSFSASSVRCRHCKREIKVETG